MKTNEKELPTMLTIAQAAQASNMTYNAVRQLCIRGTVKTVRVGVRKSKWLINRESFYRFLAGEE